jgi:hypothetical protein
MWLMPLWGILSSNNFNNALSLGRELTWSPDTAKYYREADNPVTQHLQSYSVTGNKGIKLSTSSSQWKDLRGMSGTQQPK